MIIITINRDVKVQVKSRKVVSLSLQCVCDMCIMHYSDSVLARNAWLIMVLLSAHADIAVSQFLSISISLFATTPMTQEYIHNNIIT